jgi:hypothetical protein
MERNHKLDFESGYPSFSYVNSRSITSRSDDADGNGFAAGSVSAEAGNNRSVCSGLADYACPNSKTRSKKKEKHIPYPTRRSSLLNPKLPNLYKRHLKRHTVLRFSLPVERITYIDAVLDNVSSFEKLFLSN